MMNEVRDWRIYADFAQYLIHEARNPYADEELGQYLHHTVYALDSTTIDLCMSLFPWARFRTTKSAVKMHALLDIRGSIPSFIRITDGSIHDVNILDEIIPEPETFYIMERGYLDFARPHVFTQQQAFFVTRAKINTKLQRLYSHPVDKTTGVQCDQTVVLSNFYASSDYPEKLRRVRFYDAKLEKRFVFLTNNFTLPAETIAYLYKCRWQIELFFKWIKQHLHIKSFFGTSENAVKVQIWIAVSVYVLVAIIRKRLKISLGLYSTLQIFSVSIFEKTAIYQLLTGNNVPLDVQESSKRLNLFDF
jgi:hypothetical protein